MPHVVNPFIPGFGGRPGRFFGRTEELSLMRAALENGNSPHRAALITGTRGIGKTSLLERLSVMAGDYGWLCIDVHAAHASEAIAWQLAYMLERANLRAYDELDLTELLLAACQAMPAGKGVFISVDEAQTIPEGDIENLCAAYQMCSHKGVDLMLVLAGLPETKGTISSYAGCTFMQRAPEIKLSSLLVSETYEAVERMLAVAGGCAYGPEVVAALSRASRGHPYLMQLLGYYLIKREAGRGEGRVVELHAETVDEVFPVAFQDYRANVLAPSLVRLGEGTLRYLKALGLLLDDERKASTSAIAAALGKTEQQCSSYCQNLIDRRIIVASGRGYVSCGLPYLDRYFEQLPESAPRPDAWVMWRSPRTVVSRSVLDGGDFQ